MRRFALNIGQKRLAAGLLPDPLGSLQRSPRLSSWIKGEGRGTKGRGRDREGSGKWEGKGRERKGKEDTITILSDFLATPTVINRTKVNPADLYSVS